jgi:type VI secretion system protein ImpH
VSEHHAVAKAPELLDFLDLLRRLERTEIHKPRIGMSGAHDENITVLGQSPYVEFPASNVSYFAVDSKGRYHVHSRFLGMLGPQGALPLQQSYEAKHWEEMRDPSFARFLDVFNARFLELFFRAWADARPAAQFDRPDDDRFSAYVGSVVGIATPAFRGRGSISDMTKLAVAGLLSPAIKSASRLRSLVAYLFKADVEVEQFAGMWLPLERHDQSTLGGRNAVLGNSALLGSSVYSLQDKFRIRIAASSLDEFQDFLPAGRHCEQIADAVYFYLGDLFSYEVEIGLGSFGRLGWTTWMKTKDKTIISRLRWDCRFHPAERRSAP